MPETRAVLSPPKPDGNEGTYTQAPTITLSHNDYVLWPGSLSSDYYADESLERPLPEPSLRGKAARVSGYLYAGKAGEYRLFASGGSGATRKGLYVDDELMNQLEGSAASGTVETRCYLTKGFHKIHIDAMSTKSVTGRPKLLWQPPKARRKEAIPSENQYAERSVATIYYHWDEEEPKPYTGPIEAPAGKHVLHFHAEDEAGHIEKEQALVVNVVGE